ncbi:uncharacterized protein (DUF924 family) [Dongia mobilis]|uniref:Uncharacterized protein (DUF924 family) n=1 Tax=Dongia mobilis TaxID=578943 RepID=A0A4R6WTH8_9PROT|nr:DUF924 family protein [Dongia mobilis]TDQ82200.1 uncharacterized protein (DUF924 family) [Dongia mobilis]
MTDPRAVLDFWFSDRARKVWFERDREFDAEIARRFGAAVHGAQQGAFEDWRQSPDGCLALLLLLDQMARNIYRGEAKAFLGDARARLIADDALRQGFDRMLPFDRRHFLYLPFEHSEALADQERAVELFTRHLAEAPPESKAFAEIQLDYAHRHRDVVRRAGRFPGRNAALGRETTEAEQAVLADPKLQF